MAKTILHAKWGKNRRERLQPGRPGKTLLEGLEQEVVTPLRRNLFWVYELWGEMSFWGPWSGQYGFPSIPPPWISRSSLDIWALLWAWAIQRLGLLGDFFWGNNDFPLKLQMLLWSSYKAIFLTHSWWSTILNNKTLTVQLLFWYMTQCQALLATLCVSQWKDSQFIYL